MPILTPPPAPEPARSGAPHQQRSLAESFGADAERYDRARPSYPPQIIDYVLTHSPGPRLLDVGIGTGTAARLFRAAEFDVDGVEVDPEMARIAREDGFDVAVSRFEDWEPTAPVYDAVVSAQTWHWIDPEAGAAKAAACLRPGGLLSLFWNVFQPAPAIADAFADAYDTTETGLPFNPWAQDPMAGYDTIITKITDGIEGAHAFTTPEQHQWSWTRRYTRAEWLDQVPTHGGHSRIPSPALTELLGKIGSSIDENGGYFDMPYIAVNLAAHTRAQASGAA